MARALDWTEAAWGSGTMREFFRGWRRKIGVLTLLMACVFAAGWVRSFTVTDLFVFAVGQNQTDILGSLKGSFGWQTTHQEAPHPISIYPTWIRSDNLTAKSLEAGGEAEGIRWRWRFLGFDGGYLDIDSTKAAFVSVPYWSIVLPLTAISAFLLLSKAKTIDQEENHRTHL
jgi:hypothetical protein